MPKVEKAIHLDAFKLYMQYGAITPEFLSAFAKQTGKTEKTAYRWQADLDWKERAKEPISEAVKELEAEQKIDAQELISGFFDLYQNRLESIGVKSSYIDAIFATTFDRIPTPENPNPKDPLQVKTIEDLRWLVKMNADLMKEEQTWAKMALVLVGEPDSRSETTIRIIDILREGRAQNDGS